MNERALPGKILVVDDDRLVLATVVHGLSEAGYEVIDADNGDDAILLAREHRPDLALLDIRMEGKSGFDVAAYLREYLQTPFMFLSAFTDAETTAKVRELGAVAYLVKPLDIRQIVPAVEAAFGQIRERASADSSASAARDVGAASGTGVSTGQSTGAGSTAQTRTFPVLEPQVAMAVGVLMHRYSIDRHAALDRFEAAALEERRDAQAHAEAVLKAVELLALPTRP